MDHALSDLDTAIQLSGGRGRAAEQAYTQRALIWRLRGEDERALEDFKKAANLGSHFAQKQARNLQYSLILPVSNFAYCACKTPVASAVLMAYSGIVT